MVVSGAPEKEDNHAEKVCDMALDMVDAITDLKDPSTGKNDRSVANAAFIVFIRIAQSTKGIWMGSDGRTPATR